MKDKGFTLIELLVVIAVIGILAAVAIPQYAAYRTRSFDSRAETDLRHLVTAQEAYFADNQIYTKTISALPGFKTSSGVTVKVTKASESDFTATAKHSSGSKTFKYDSDKGKITP